MAHEIIKEDVASENENRLIVDSTHTTPVRKHIYGSDWTSLRLIARFSTDRNSDWTSPPRMYMGLCAGTSSPPGSVTPNHFVGVTTNTSNWTWIPSQSYCRHGLAFTKIENGTPTDISIENPGSSGPGTFYSGFGRTVLIIDFTKGTPWTIRCVYQRANAPGTVSLATYKDMLDYPLGFTKATEYDESTTTAWTLDEGTYGEFDSACFAFFGSTSFKLSDINVVRLD